VRRRRSDWHDHCIHFVMEKDMGHRLGVCSYCQRGGHELRADGMLEAHPFVNSMEWCTGGGSVPETTYLAKHTIRVPEADPVPAFSFGTFGDLLKKAKRS